MYFLVMAGPFWPGVQQHYPSLALRRNPARAGNSLGTAIYRKGGIMDNLRYDWKTRTPENSWQKTPAGNYTTNAIYRAVIGNYIVLSLYQVDGGRKYGLYLSIMVWKEDGCKDNKTCQAQRVASFSAKLPPPAALALAEEWFSGFLRDQISFSRLGLSELLK